MGLSIKMEKKPEQTRSNKSLLLEMTKLKLIIMIRKRKVMKTIFVVTTSCNNSSQRLLNRMLMLE